MALDIDFDVELPRRRNTMGRQAYHWEDDLAPVKKNGEAGRFYLVKRFDSKSLDENQKQATAMARQINRRMTSVDGTSGWHARAWPLPGKDGSPLLNDKAPYGCWVKFTGEPKKPRAPRKDTNKENGA